MFDELKAHLKEQYSEKWFVEHGATIDGLTRVDDGTLHGLFAFYGEAPDMEFVVKMRNELPAILERMERLEEASKVMLEAWFIHEMEFRDLILSDVYARSDWPETCGQEEVDNMEAAAKALREVLDA